MKACTLGIGTGANRDQFRKDKRGRKRARFSQRAAPATGKDQLRAGPSRRMWDENAGEYRLVKCGHFTTAEMRALNAKVSR